MTSLMRLLLAFTIHALPVSLLVVSTACDAPDDDDDDDDSDDDDDTGEGEGEGEGEEGEGEEGEGEEGEGEGPVIPAAWRCADSRYDAGSVCDCGCGAADPDCPDAELSSCD